MKLTISLTLSLLASLFIQRRDFQNAGWVAPSPKPRPAPTQARARKHLKAARARCFKLVLARLEADVGLRKSRPGKFFPPLAHSVDDEART